MFILTKGSCLYFSLAKIQRDGKTGIISNFETTIPFVVGGSCFASCRCNGLHPSAPNFSSILTSLHLVGYSPFDSIRAEVGSWCWKVIECRVPRSLWDGRGQDFWDVKSLLLIFLLRLGKWDFVHSFWSLHSQQQQKQPRKGPGLLLTAHGTRGIVRNSKR